jgi:hypothetical protein
MRWGAKRLGGLGAAVRRALGLVALLLALRVEAVAAEAPARPLRPNGVVILADDRGYADLGAQSSLPEVRTPHLDEASPGMRALRATT